MPPWYSCGLSFPSRARVARSFTLLLIEDKPNASTFLTIGVIKPFGVATATEISTDGFNSGLPLKKNNKIKNINNKIWTNNN